MARHVWLRAAAWTLVVIFSSATFNVVFQSLMRYRYERIDGIVWRVDELTNQRCPVIRGRIYCSNSHSTSVSPSLSTSVSTSLSRN